VCGYALHDVEPTTVLAIVMIEVSASV